MRAALLLICLFFTAQDDPYKILQDPARRAKEFDRQTALKAFRDQAQSSPAAWVAARYLSRPDKDWKLTPAASSELDAYLKTWWTGAALSDADHRKALEALEQSIAKAGDGAEALKVFMLLHASVLGDRASDIIGKFGYVKEGERWGKREDLAVSAIAASLAKKASVVGTVTGDVESKARSAGTFGPKYAVALFDLSRVFSSNQGYENSYKALLTMAGPTAASPRVAEHFKALADSIKAALYCRACKDGKMACTLCNGKKRLDIACSNCHGLQWAQKAGAAGGILVRCQKCQGIGTFKNAGCPRCNQSGVINCPSAAGSRGATASRAARTARSARRARAARRPRRIAPPAEARGGSAPPPSAFPSIRATRARDSRSSRRTAPPARSRGWRPARTAATACATRVGAQKLEAISQPSSPARRGPSARASPLPKPRGPVRPCQGLGVHRGSPRPDPARR
jgi:hypothetical protein